MRILAVNSGVSGMHDPAAVLVEDGKVLMAIEEERFVGIKHAPEMLPLNAVKFVLKTHGLKITDIDKFVYPNLPDLMNLLRRGSLKRPYTYLGSLRIYRDIKNRVKHFYRYHFRIDPNIIYMKHHVGHAASAFYLSGFNKANIITMDAAGERTCGLLAVGKDSDIEIEKEFYVPNSWGYIYSALTEFLGYKVGDEGTVMALASFGQPKYDFFKNGIVRLTDDGYWINPRFGSIQYTDAMLKMFGEPRLSGELTQHHKDVAASLQDAIEKTLVHLARIMHEKTGYKNFCLAGGSALNCKMNGVLLQQDFVDDIFIQPAASDQGGALGGAVMVAVNNGYKVDKMRHAYLGSENSNEEIEKTLKVAKVKYEEISDPAGTAAEILAQNKILGWVQGRMEFGPRALGNRSILTSAQDPSMKNILNDNVKHREPFRPFCPSLVAEAAPKYFNGKLRDSPFMILSFDVKEEMRNRVPSIVHVDGSARPQFVEKEINPLYYSLIQKFGDITGDPVILNTSFNDKGQPMIRTAEQAVKMYYGTGMDALIVGNFILQK
ncbi:MAG TPA: carbamoyltransferase C-terminal domain-containing protein [archaeon]|nr:carbamoyltransferase C-terminal domain-containing protein [archaeon]